MPPTVTFMPVAGLDCESTAIFASGAVILRNGLTNWQRKNAKRIGYAVKLCVPTHCLQLTLERPVVPQVANSSQKFDYAF